MEIGKTQIARLVLGYLKNEKCSTAFNEFLTTSQYLKQQAIFIKNGKYFATRVGGLTLEDIIREYSEMSFIIQGKLEQTSYYEEEHKMNLVEQLIYILDNPQPIPTLSKDLNTTPSESLPGNSIEPENMGNISQILSHTLLDKPELHEKLADAINSVRVSQDDNAGKELDNKIKTIVQKAEEDPIFDKILHELIDNNPEIPDQNASKSSFNNQQISNTSKTDNSTKKTSTPKLVEKKDSGEMSTEKSTNAPSFSVQSSSSSIFTSTPTIRTSTPTIHTSTSTVITSTPSTNSEVYIYKGNLDTYVGNTGSMPTKPNQIYVANAPGLIMVPSMITAPNYLIVNSQTNPLSNVLTDTDIMKMPTVILDEGAQSKNTKQNAPQQSTSQKCKPLVPKSDGITISTKTGDYLATYNKDGVVVVSSEEDIVPKRRRPGLRKKLPRQAKMKKKETKPKEEKQKSPTTPINKTVSKKSTPRSGSHVRTLNFASPSKGRERRESDSFNKESKNDTNVVQDDVRPISAWDSDLRELLIPKPRIKPQSPDSSDDKLDLTCEDDEELEKGAKLIEDAFKTPVKKATDDENEPLDLPMKTEVETMVVCEKQEESQNAKKGSPIEVVTVEQTEICLRNINVPPRFKKKCNISNNTVQHCEIEVVIERNEVADKQVSEIIKKREAQLKETRTTSTKTIVLETPSKALPKTPGKSELTPFSKALEEQLQGMDLLEIQTPNILATPSFPLTPGLGLISPMPVNRPTDYSTSSSYYQPSDTEQNKSLELMIEECKRLEKKRLKESETNTNIDEENIDSSNNKTVTNLSEVKRVFNENVIGKKNLNLLKHKSSSSSSSEDSSSSYSSSSDSSTSGSDSEYDPSQNNDTVVKNNYCLRTRSTSIVEDELHKPSTSKTPVKIKSVVEEIEDKRERMKNSLKKDLKNTPKVTNPIKDKMSKITKKTPSRKKARTPVKKLTPKRVEQLSKVCEVENEITDDDFALHLSTDEETINKSTIETDKNSEEPNRKVELTQKALMSPQKNMDKETPDIEAEKLVQGLKERGIHLVHKKSPKKSTEITEDELKEHNTDKEKSKVILKNADIISDNGTDQKKNEVEILNSSLELSSNDLDVTFDIQHFENENVKTEYNYGKKKSKKMVYDSKCLEKEMKASVYIESLDMEMDRIIKCTPFEMIFNFTPKTETKRRKSTSSGKTIKLNVDSLVQKKHKDKKVDSDKKVKVDKQKKKTKQSFTATERVKEESDKKLDHQPSSIKHSVEKTLNDSNSDKCVKNNSEPKNLSLVDTEKDNGSGLGIQAIKSVHKTEVEESCSNNEGVLNTEAEKSPIRASDDELMNYAILGSQREENAESPKSGNKRKYSSSEEGEPAGKKCKTEQQQALLKKIDVDSFLNKVHGNLT